MPVKIDHRSIPRFTRVLLASDAIPGLQEHFSNPENQRRFKEWQEARKMRGLQGRRR